MEKLYTVKETAEYLRVSQRTVFNYIKSGKLKTIKFSERVMRIEESEIKRLKGE